ncbi:succinate dehydrogenase assembly factor 2 [Parasphingorhabdus flavimaris]|jgi:antitoxin CptB|uniref:FAD assembly factor SdhE n=1 Tax=Parasphingorhabdus flavimaris TaxID=266812 RepID=A0ABX2N1K0_9SPHN|nr:succinate dehydrogenase assembly factor 2 [Parasphingorhabdus flavimaris]NVD27577.1 succinate dehydrogenase assembly factor 2 [Parasphingorhabdus flavimaris]|tara:strand:+ start:440 stop:706 length:267 start_codon:yes stop_codon:yes gene_type:complete
MDRETKLKRLQFRAWHRGTREADFLIGGFFDRYSQGWSDTEIDWFESLLVEDDVDVMAWAIGTQPVPEVFAGPQMDVMQRLDYIDATK